MQLVRSMLFVCEVTFQSYESSRHLSIYRPHTVKASPFKSSREAANINTVKPRLSNASVLDQIGFRTINSRFLRFRLRTKIRISTKPKEAERTRMRHDAAYVGFFHTIFGVTELLYFFLLLD